MTKKRKTIRYEDPTLSLNSTSSKGRTWPIYEDWINASAWELTEAVFLLHDQHPIAPDFPRDEHGDPLSDERVIHMNREMEKSLSLAKRSIIAGELKPIEKNHVNPREFLLWATKKQIEIPDGFQILVENDKYAPSEPLDANGKKELGELRVEKEKWHLSIMAAVHIGLFAEKQKEELTRDQIKDEMCAAGFSTVPDTTFEKIRKALPSEYRKGSGRPKDKSKKN